MVELDAYDKALNYMQTAIVVDSDGIALVKAALKGPRQRELLCSNVFADFIYTHRHAIVQLCGGVVGSHLPRDTNMPKVRMSLGDDLKMIRSHAERALDDAKQVRDRFGTDLIDWDTVSVEAVEYFIDDANNEGYRVWIGEADAPTLAQFIRVWLAEEGFEDVRVKTEN